MRGAPFNDDQSEILLMRRAVACCVFLTVLCWPGLAEAARTFTDSPQSPGAGSAFNMGSTQLLTYPITNTNTAPNTGERIYQVRFRLNSGSTFSGSTAAPAGWTRTAFSTTSVTFRANSWANAIVLSATTSFTVAIIMRTTSADAGSETLRDIRSYYTTTTTGPPFTQAGTTTFTLQGSWILRSLAITTFEFTDTSGNPITAITAGSSFQLRMTVKNNSSVTQAAVVSNANPPAGTWVGSGPSPACAAGGTMSLVSGASGTIIFSCTSVATASGTLFYTATARNGAAVTSSSATSTILAVSKFNASVAGSLSCLYAGATLTITMTIVNNTGAAVTAISGSLAPVAGAPLTYVSGPTPAVIASLANAGTTTVTWVYTLNSSGATNPFTFSGSAMGTQGVSILTSPTATTSNITLGTFAVTVNPTTVNAASTNTELSFDVTNNGCANVNSVGITAPAGWSWGGDAYSLVNLSAVSAIETWTVGGANPVIFTAPNVAGQLPLTFSGDYNLVYTATPASATVSSFTVRVTDAGGSFSDVPVSVTVSAFKSGTLNDALNLIWREDFR